MPSYRDAGVDIEAGERLVAAIADDVTSTWSGGVVGGFGGFAAGIEIPAGYQHPVLMMSTDGVGTKIEVARRAGRIDGLGYDLVAMCVDDLAAVGARPLAFTDYLATGRLNASRDGALVASIAAACREAGCALLGGETAEHPGVMDPDQFDLAGAALGVMEKGRQVDGAAIEPGDVIVGLASPNLRSNGFSLVRAVVDLDALGEPFPGDPTTTIGEVLVAPSVIYAPAVGALLETGAATGLAHITGGGLPGNAGRPLPPGLTATIDPDTWQPPNVFDFVQQQGGLASTDMYGTFNMGIGYVVYCRSGSEAEVIAASQSLGHGAHVIGEVTRGRSPVWIDGVTTDSRIHNPTD